MKFGSVCSGIEAASVAWESLGFEACGNSMAVPVMRWIGKRIQLIDTILNG